MTENLQGEDTNSCVFWEIHVSEKDKTTVTISTDKLIDFCSKVLNFYNYIDHAGNYILVQVTNKCIVSESRIQELKQAIKHYLRNQVKKEVVWTEFAKRNWISENVLHLIEILPEAKFNLSHKDQAYFFYQNGIVCISKAKPKVIPYKNFEGFVWKQQIINRNFIDCGNEFENCEFKRFLINVCGQDRRRYFSLISIIGYLLHPYKDPSFTKAVILLDEKIDLSGGAHGGTGKSLIFKGISHMTTMVWKDGKKFNSRETFVFDDVRPYHRLVYFDDVKLIFSFEDLFAMITGNLRVERKYRDSTLLPFEISPKIAMSSNHMVKGTGGYTDERRRLEFEIASYYSKSLTPRDEFGHNLFEDWDEHERSRFDKFMLRCVDYYIKHGVIEPPKINIEENRLNIDTNPEFVIYMDSEAPLNTPLDKADLLAGFKSIVPTQRLLSAITFKKWIDKWASARDYLAKHYKSNGKHMVIFTKKSLNKSAL